MGKQLLNENLAKDLEQFYSPKGQIEGQLAATKTMFEGKDLSTFGSDTKSKNLDVRDNEGKIVKPSTVELARKYHGVGKSIFSDDVQMDKLAESYAKDLEVARENRLEELAQSQGYVSKAFAGFTRFTGRVFTSVANSTVGLVWGVGEALANGDYTRLYDNEFVRKMDDLYEYLREATPIYETKDAGGFQKTFNFLMDDFADGMGFATGAVLSLVTGSAGVTAVRGLAALSHTQKVAKGMKTLKQAETATKELSKQIGKQQARSRIGQATQQLAFGTFNEASMESRTTFDDARDKMIGSFVAENGRDPNKHELKEIEEYATTAANVTFLANTALVGFTNLRVLPAVFNAKFLPKSEGLKKHLKLNNINPKEHVKMLNKLDPNNMSWRAKMWGGKWGVKTLGKNAFYEGVVEEGGQGVISGTMQDFAFYSYRGGEYNFENLAKASTDAFQHTYGTSEGLREVLVGALIGSTGVYMPVKSKFNSKTGKNEYTFDPIGFEGGIKGSMEEVVKKQEKVQKVVDAINNNPDLVRSLAVKKQGAKRQEAYANIMDDAVERGDEFEYHNAKDSGFNSWAYERIALELDELALEELEAVKNMSVEDYKSEFGIDEKTEITEQDIAQKVDELKNRFNEVKSAYQIVEDKFDGYLNDLGKASLVHNLSMIDRYEQREVELKKEITESSDNLININEILEKASIKEILEDGETSVSGIDPKIIQAELFSILRKNLENKNLVKNFSKISKQMFDAARLDIRQKNMLMEFNALEEAVVKGLNNKQGKKIKEGFDKLEDDINKDIDNNKKTHKDTVTKDRVKEEVKEEEEREKQEKIDAEKKAAAVKEELNTPTTIEKSIEELEKKYDAEIIYDEKTGEFAYEFNNPEAIDPEVLSMNEINLEDELNNLKESKESTATKEDYNKLLENAKNAKNADEVLSIFENFKQEFGGVPRNILIEIQNIYEEKNPEEKSNNKTGNKQTNESKNSDVNDSVEVNPQPLTDAKEQEITDLLNDADAISYIDNEKIVKKNGIRYIGHKVVDTARSIAIHTRDFIRVAVGKDAVAKKEISDEIASKANVKVLSPNHYLPGTKLRIRLVEESEIDGTDNEGNPIIIDQSEKLGTPNQIMEIIDSSGQVVGYIREVDRINKETTAHETKDNKDNIAVQKNALKTFREKVFEYLQENKSFDIEISAKGTGVLMYNTNRQKRTKVKDLIKEDTRPAYVYVTKEGDLHSSNPEILGLLEIPESLEKNLSALKGFTFLAVPAANGRYLLIPAKPARLHEINPADIPTSIKAVLEAYLANDAKTLQEFGVENNSKSVKEYVENFIQTSSNSKNENYLYIDDSPEKGRSIRFYRPGDKGSYLLTADKLMHGEFIQQQHKDLDKFLKNPNKIISINFKSLNSNKILKLKTRNESDGIKEISYKDFVNATTTVSIHSQEVTIGKETQRVYTHNPVMQFEALDTIIPEQKTKAETKKDTKAIKQIKADRKAELDKTNKRIEKIEKKGDSAIIVKIEYYDTIDVSGEKVRVEIQTYKDGRRVLKSYIIEKDGSINTAEPYINERINNKAQLELTNEGLIKGYIGNEENALTKVNEDLNPNQTYIDKINAKYDALRDAELAKQKAETKPQDTKTIEKIEADRKADLKESFGNSVELIASKNETVIQRNGLWGVSGKDYTPQNVPTKQIFEQFDKINAKYDAKLKALEETSTQPSTSVKEGVLELFESNPELASEIYEAMGFEQGSNLNKLLPRNEGYYSETESIKKDLENSEYSFLIPIIDNLKIKFAYNSGLDDFGMAGGTDSAGNIMIHPKYKAVDLIAHEIVHGAIKKLEGIKGEIITDKYGNISTFYQEFRKEADNLSDSIVKSLKEYRKVQKDNSLWAKKLDTWLKHIEYSGKEEVITFALTDKNFQKILKELPSTYTKKTNNKSAWSDFLSLIEKFLQIFKLEKTQLNSIIDLLEDYIPTNIPITSQQKQQAQQAYSNYLESLNKPNTNPVLQGNQQEQLKKFAELQERLNNKEFIEGAKFVYESSEGLKSFGTQEQYNDYIAKVSLGIVKNPSSGEYNYNSQVKDIVYHFGISKITDTFNKGLGVLGEIYFTNDNEGKNIFYPSDGKPKNKKNRTEVILNIKRARYGEKEKIFKTTKDREIYFNNLKILSELNKRVDDLYAQNAPKEEIKKAIDELNNFEPSSYEYTSEFRSEERLKQKPQNTDGLVLHKPLTGLYTDETFYVVFEPEQIHILGGKQDIEGFKEFIGSSTPKKTKRNKNNKNYNFSLKNNSVSLNAESESYYSTTNLGTPIQSLVTKSEWNEMSTEEKKKLIECK